METILAGTIIFVAIFLGFKFGRKKNIENHSVKAMLETLGDEYRVFSDVVISAQHGMSYIDFVMVSPFGVFVIDIKYEAGKVFGDVGQREWATGKKHTIYNPIWRNRTHVNGLEKLLGLLPYISLVVFVNGRLKSDFGANVVELPGMLLFLKRHQRQTLEPDRRTEIIDILEKKQTEE